jgi:hypothetical protein
MDAAVEERPASEAVRQEDPQVSGISRDSQTASEYVFPDHESI